MHFGIQCGDGWFSLIDRLLRRIQIHADDVELQPVVLQIKEKLGALRVYWRDADDVVRGITYFAEDLSETVCEVCGHPGAIVSNRCGARRTRCESHQDIANPDEPDRPSHPDQRPRTRRRADPVDTSMTPAADLPDQVLFDAALLLASELGRLSVAILQARLKLGYARARQLHDAVLGASRSNLTPTFPHAE